MAQIRPINVISARLQSLTSPPKCDAANEDWGSSAEVSAFVEALRRIDAGMFKITAGDIIKVLQSWRSCEDTAWDSGYLVELADGRRADIMISVEAHDWDNEEGIKVSVDLRPGGFDYGSRNISRSHCSQVFGFTDHVDLFNDFLDTLRAISP